MNIKIIFVVSLLLFTVGMAFVFPGSFNLCEGYQECRAYDYYEIYGALLALLAPVIFFISLIVFIYRTARQTFNSWLRFAKYYIPIALVLILLSPTTAVGIGAFDRELVTWFLAGIFFVVSLSIISFKFFKKRQEI